MKMMPLPYSMRLVTATAVMVASWLLSPGVETVDTDALKIQCDNMAPLDWDLNSMKSNDTACPYKLLVKSPVIPGDLVNLTLTSVDGRVPFRAFMIQVRNSTDNRLLGTFMPPCDNKTNHYHQVINCTNGFDPKILDPNNTAIHSNNGFKLKEDMTWLSPIKLKGTIQFSYTVMYDEKKFWINQQTDPITVEHISKEDFNVKTYIHNYDFEWYMQQFFRKNCIGPIF